MTDSNSDIDISATGEDDVSSSPSHSSPHPYLSKPLERKQNPLTVAEKVAGGHPELPRAEDEKGQKARRTLETKNVTLVVLSFIATAAFTTVCNLPSSFLVTPEKLEFPAADVITAQLPPIFYLMVFNSAVFAVCLAAVSALLWSLSLGPVVMFLSVATGVVYAILVKSVIPEMLVRVGNGTIEGANLVGLLALGFICVGAILYYCLSRGYKIIKRVISKTTRESKHIP